MAKVYNTTDLRPDQAFERHVFHRDQFAHYLRWTHILKEAKIGESIVDFGCGAANLLEVLYRNTAGVRDWDVAIQGTLTALEFDAVQDESDQITRILG